MPQQNPSSRTSIARLFFLAVLGWTLSILHRSGDEASESTKTGRVTAARMTLFAPRKRVRSRKRRLATSLAFATLFFAGASLSAIAGDSLVNPDDGTSTDAATTTGPEDEGEAPDEGTPPEETPAEEEPPAEETPAEEEPPAEETPAEDPSDGTTDPGETPEDGATDPETPGEAPETPGEAPDDGGSAAPGSGGHGSKPGKDKTGTPVVAPHKHADDDTLDGVDPEADEYEGSTIWLHRTLPDPTPPAKRLAPKFAKMLRAEAKATGAGWAMIMATLRADGRDGRWPASRARVHAVGTNLAAVKAKTAWLTFLALRGKTAWADEAEALTHYNRAVGLKSLVRGLDASKQRLGRKVLNDRRIAIYGGGANDIAANKIDVRVLVLLEYLAAAHGQVTVSSLVSGHRYYSRPGTVSAHVYGLAVDIAVLSNQAIYGHQQVGGITEKAVRNILLLPAEISPRQVISLLGLGGASFPLADHDDHIHVGF